MYLQVKKEQIMVDTNEWKNQYTLFSEQQQLAMAWCF